MPGHRPPSCPDPQIVSIDPRDIRVDFLWHPLTHELDWVVVTDNCGNVLLQLPAMLDETYDPVVVTTPELLSLAEQAA